MKVTLINPVTPLLIGTGSGFHLPYGLAVLISRLRREEITADISDVNIIVKKTFPRDKFRKLLHLLRRFHQLQREKKQYCGIEDATNSILASELVRLSNIDTSDLIGISVLSVTELPISLLIAEYVYTHLRVPVVLGGTYVTLNAGCFFSAIRFSSLCYYR